MISSFHVTYAVCTFSTVLSKDSLIRIAAAVGAVIASLGLAYLIIKATNCCACIRPKPQQNSNSACQDDTNNDEQSRLTVIATTPATNNNQEGDSGGGGNEMTNLDIDDNAGSVSDSDSLPEMNEMPPSYESLYLTEELSEEPPVYSPPQHKERHPPRRVHTFN